MIKEESLTSKTFKGFFWSLGGKLLTAILQIGVLAVLARLINAESFGIVQSALVVVGFAQIVSKIGIGPALVQIKSLTDKHIRVGFTFSMGIGLVLTICVFLTSDLIASFFKMTDLSLVLKVISVLFIFESFITVSSSLLQREMKLKRKALIELWSYFFGYGLVGIILGYLEYDYWALVIAIITQSVFKAVAYSLSQNHSFSLLWNKDELSDLLRFAGGYTIGRICSYIATQGDNIITGRYLGAGALGIYSRAYAIMTKPASMVGDALNIALFPAMAARQTQFDKLNKVFLNGSKMILFVSILSSFVIASGAKEIVIILLGKSWDEAIVPLQILASGLFFRLGYKLGAELSKATGNVNKQAFYYFLYALATITGCLVGTQWGIIGVAYGTLFAIIINYALMTHLGLTILKMKWTVFIKSILPEVLVSCLIGLSFVVIITVARQLLMSEVLVLIVSCCLFGTLLLFIFYFFGKKLSFIELLPFKDKLKRFMR